MLSRQDFIVKAPAAGIAASLSTNLSWVGNAASSTVHEIVLRSSGGNLEILVSINSAGRLPYSVQESGVAVLVSSPLGLAVDGVDLRQDARIAGRPRIRDIDETYSIFGNHAQARNQTKEAIVPAETAGKRFSLVVRAYDDVSALRNLLPKNAKHIGALRGMAPAGVYGKVVCAEYASNYEGLSHATKIDQIPENHPVMAPITVALPDHYLSISEADCESCSDMSVTRHENLLQATFTLEPTG